MILGSKPKKFKKSEVREKVRQYYKKVCTSLNNNVYSLLSTINSCPKNHPNLSEKRFLQDLKYNRNEHSVFVLDRA